MENGLMFEKELTLKLSRIRGMLLSREDFTRTRFELREPPEI